MAYFEVVNRSPAGPDGVTTYFSEEGMGDWAYAPIVEMVSRAFNGTVWNYDYLTMEMSNVPGFPKLYFRVYGHFTFKQDYSSTGWKPYVADGSVINMVEVIDAAGNVYNRLSGINFAIEGDKTTKYNEPLIVLNTRFGPLETPDEGWMLSGNDTVRGNNLGAEKLRGYAGNDTVQGLGGSDLLFGEAGNDILEGGADADDLYGGVGNDTIMGYTAGDYIDGGEGFDTWALMGTYTTGMGLPPVVDMTGVTFLNIEAIKVTYGEIVLNSNQVGGTSTVQTIFAGSGGRDMLRVVMAPGATVMNLSTVDFVDWNNWSGDFGVVTLLGSAAGDTIDGSEVNDVIFAHGGTNTVRGGQGSDYIVGGGQADILRGGDKSDTLDGGAGNDVLIGDDDYSISGSAQPGDDVIHGGAGDDMMMGLRGFNVFHGGDGQDTVDYGFIAQNPSDSYQAPVHVLIDLSRPVDPTNPNSGFTSYIDLDYGEVFIPALRDILVGVEHIDGSGYNDRIIGDGQGNRLRGQGGNDSLNGGAGNDTLEGGQGTDSLVGGIGNDTFIVTLAGDSIVEGAGGGTDTVRASISQVLAAEVENLVLTGTTNLGGTGNELANVLTGNAGANTLKGLDGHDRLDGGAGLDRLEGGAGNDTYVLATAGDTVVELAGGGTDTVYAGFSHALGAQVETLILTGTGTLTGTGNTLANAIFGNFAANTLRGLDGNDRLEGRAGVDRLEGGLGNDAFQFAFLAEAGDTVADFSNLSGNNDVIRISAAGFGGGLVAGAVLLASQFRVRADNLAQDGDDRFVFRSTDTTLWFDSNGNGAGGLTLVADLQAGATMTAADILLF